jgi:glucose-6-phosphate 1-epimerase
MDVTQLNNNFAIPDVLHFDKHGELDRATVTMPVCTATVYLQGAHLALWQPSGHQPVLFLSRDSEFLPGKPIRGGVPIAFPWFAADSNTSRYQGKPGPSHGFARIEPWKLEFAALSGDELHLTFTLGPSELSRNMGFDHFALVYEITLGRTLTMRLTVANRGTKPLHFEEALHSYYQVGDAHEVTVTGLEPTPYIDKTRNFVLEPAAQKPVSFVGSTDRVYLNTAATCALRDPLMKRTITIEKQSSKTTVLFNPWRDLPDLGGSQWHEMVAVETANTGDNAITLGPNESHTMQAHVTVQHNS